jgi:hypothetical protein
MHASYLGELQLKSGHDGEEACLQTVESTRDARRIRILAIATAQAIR